MKYSMKFGRIIAGIQKRFLVTNMFMDCLPKSERKSTRKRCLFLLQSTHLTFLIRRVYSEQWEKLWIVLQIPTK